MTAYATCSTCGSVLLWINGELACARRHPTEDLAAASSPRFDGAEPADRAGGSTAAGGSAHSLRGVEP
jgi:hypothetical protein